MGVLDKFLDAIKLNDDYDDDGFLDDDLLEGEDDEDFLDDDFEDKPKKKFFDKFTKKKDSSEDEDFDDFDEKPLKSESKQTSSLKQPTASGSESSGQTGTCRTPDTSGSIFQDHSYEKQP